MLSSSQCQAIEDALKAGKIVKRFTDRVIAVENLAGVPPVLIMLAGLHMSSESVKADEVLIGEFLHTLRPH